MSYQSLTDGIYDHHRRKVHNILNSPHGDAEWREMALRDEYDRYLRAADKARGLNVTTINTAEDEESHEYQAN